MPDSGPAGRAGAGRSFFRELASGRRELFEAVLRFNACAPPSPDGLPPSVAEAMDASPRGRQVRIRLAGGGVGYWNFEEESTRLALVEPETLESLVLHFGAAVNARAFATVVRRADRQALAAEVGADLIGYALGRGGFHLGETRDHFLPRHGDRPLAERVRLHGLEALGICAGRWPEALSALAGERFPGLVDAAPQADGRDHKLERLVWFGLKKLLTKEVAPQWAPCFS